MDVVNRTINADKWIKNYYSYLQNYTRVRVSNPQDVEEIISDTFLAALKAKANFKNKCSERTWLTAILKNKIVDHYRKQASHKGKMNKYMLSHDEYKEMYHFDTAISQCEESTLSEINLNNLESILTESLSQLPLSQSNVAKMRIYDELSTEEICKILNISKNNAWVLSLIHISEPRD